jgi:hypothetical protein
MRAEANAIIVALMQSDDFNNCMIKVKPSLKEDLISELTLILLETDAAVIIDMYENKRLNFFTARILLRLAFSKTSPIYRKYKTTTCEFIDKGYTDDHSIINRKITEERALDEIEKLEWYESEMVKLYLEVGTYRKMSQATHIPVMSCFQAIKIATEKIKRVI